MHGGVKLPDYEDEARTLLERYTVRWENGRLYIHPDYLRGVVGEVAQLLRARASARTDLTHWKEMLEECQDRLRETRELYDLHREGCDILVRSMRAELDAGARLLAEAERRAYDASTHHSTASVEVRDTSEQKR